MEPGSHERHALRVVFHDVFCPAITAVVLRHEKAGTGASHRVLGTERGRFESVTVYTSRPHRRGCEERGYRPIVITLPDPVYGRLVRDPGRLWDITAGDNVHTRKSTIIHDVRAALVASEPEARRVLEVLTSIAILTEDP